MIVSHKYKYIFASVPKSGTHTMYKILQEQFDGNRIPGKRAFHGVMKCGRIPKEYEKYYKFTIVNNPFRRAISCWKPLISREPYRIKRKWLKKIGSEKFIDFTRYIKIHKNDKNKSPLISAQALLPHANENYDKILHLNNIDTEFFEMPFVDKEINIHKGFSHNHFNTEDAWKEMYNDEAIQNVLDAWGIDFDFYGYSKEL